MRRAACGRKPAVSAQGTKDEAGKPGHENALLHLDEAERPSNNTPTQYVRLVYTVHRPIP
ncbi:MAG TPA: hypothetical protein PLH34_01780 [Bacillota bacterium]|nr:hypothetical protein [Bacillota bacterium]